MRKSRIYVDTSVIGGCFDDEFADDSKALIEMAKRGEIILLVSDLLIDELEEAPEKVKNIIKDLPKGAVENLNRSNNQMRYALCICRDRLLDQLQKMMPCMWLLPRLPERV